MNDLIAKVNEAAFYDIPEKRVVRWKGADWGTQIISKYLTTGELLKTNCNVHNLFSIGLKRAPGQWGYTTIQEVRKGLGILGITLDEQMTSTWLEVDQTPKIQTPFCQGTDTAIDTLSGNILEIAKNTERDLTQDTAQRYLSDMRSALSFATEEAIKQVENPTKGFDFWLKQV